MIKIIITGPESTGKSTLTKNLSLALKEPFVPEYARYFLPTLKYEYTSETLIEIASGQLFWHTLFSSSAKKMLICGTGLEAIYIWHQFRFNEVKNELAEQLKKEKEALYFLCTPDIPWVEDPLRETPFQRHEIFKAFISLFEAFNFNYYIIEGQTERERLEQVLQILKKVVI